MEVTFVEWGTQLPSRFGQLAENMVFVYVRVRFDNGSTEPVSVNRFDFRLQDGSGVRRTFHMFGDRNDQLDSGEVAPGAFLSGTLVFEVPVVDTSRSLIYDAHAYAQLTFLLR